MRANTGVLNPGRLGSCPRLFVCVCVCVSSTLTSELLGLSLKDFDAQYLANALGDFKTNYTF